ncbi:MAG TPA: penicillin acylase family protein, partial [Flavitalea sp.]|nr:penicillin acylase family protein [Flavitalea sp.]
LLNYTPEHWTNLKTYLFLMYMSYDLTGGEDDIELTNMRSVFSRHTLDQLFPITQDSLDPIVPYGTVFDSAGIRPKIPASADSLYFAKKDSIEVDVIKPDADNGSNNWAVSGSKTSSGRPILCNDPHLGVNLPSLWYEMQLSSPTHNVYGVSFPGAPSVVIGFNDSIAWGLTNAMRDVKDYYAIDFRDETHTSYKFNSEWKDAESRVEEYKVKGGPSIYDTIAYTVFGPVVYDNHFNGHGRTAGQNLAVTWKAFEAGNELQALVGLNHANNCDDYTKAINFFHCPGQNFVFASKSNQVAIWQQAEFPAKWYRQGDFVMPGTDSSYMWQGNIPFAENPHVINPPYGYVSSANQLPVDTTYPYYIGGHHDMYRGKMINRFLDRMHNITPEDMQRLQNENENLFAESILPLMLRNVSRNALSDDERNYLNMAETWNFRNDPDEKGPTIFETWFMELEKAVWNDELEKAPKPWKMPSDYTLVEALIRDSAFSYIDNITTPEHETLQQVVTQAFQKAIVTIAAANQDGRLTWSRFKDSGIRHLLRLEPFSRYHLRTGGGENVINATKQFHAPSWRMVVHLTDDIEAYGIYPGGQSGNPGSKFYDNFVDDWASGKYNRLWFMKAAQKNDAQVKYVINFSKS